MIKWLVLMVLLVPVVSLAGTERWSMNHDRVAPTWVLPQAVAPSNMQWVKPNMPGDVRGNRFWPSQKCRECHSELYDQWKGSMMANAWSDPIFQSVYKSFIDRSKTPGEQAETAMCSRCHTPIGYVADEPGRYMTSQLSATAQEGISCDACHTVAMTAGIGNAPFIFAPGDAASGNAGTKFGPRGDSQSPFHQTKYSELHTRSEMCGMCHDVAHARNTMSIESTYSEWRQSPYNTGDPLTTVECQDCHMRQNEQNVGIATEQASMPGYAAEQSRGAKKRDHVWQHNFVGANLASTALLGHNPQARMAAERLKKAVELEAVDLKPVRRPGLYKMSLKVSNVGAGHYLPTGMTFVREMWLDVMVTDRQGRVVYRSGELNDMGDIQPGAVVYKTVLGEGGKERQPTFFLPGATQVLSDKRIRPKGFAVEDFMFIVRDWAEYPLKLEAKVRYRSAPQWLIREMMGEKAPTVPIYDMYVLKAELPMK